MPLLVQIGMLLLSYLPRIAGALVSAAPAIAAVSVLATALAAGFQVLQIARSALDAAAGAYGGNLWCALNACGAPQGLYWYVVGIGVALSFVVADKVSKATASVASRIANSVSK